ncbi:hypothetical protein GBAR_LOCUS2758 [Geodia barretti]|uniref:Uncharacterized protein n=1 Tax=Geodia barretti TaxID=519541 RepID=A0AA35VZF2_GEOBA|nr:hypothetical protein GBAR_LOCUS2757 [Geodia barretti]CAI7999642.1 hypothetical protein GBAR_LOCUS2758 [Geodia barretti]
MLEPIVHVRPLEGGEVDSQSLDQVLVAVGEVEKVQDLLHFSDGVVL